MKSSRFTKIFTILLVLLGVSLFNNVFAQEECDEDGFIVNSYCPCPPDPGIASVCGFVSDANITQDLPDTGIERAIWSTRKPVPGVTVTIYENNPDIPTGKPYGKLDRKFGACYTTEEEGKYHCLMRRLNPGNMAYVIFSCDGKIADMKIIPTVKSYIGLDSDIDCSGEYSYNALDDELDFAERSNFLGCLSTSDEEENVNAGFEEPEYIYKSADIGEKGGDIRFNPFTGVLPIVGVHNGAFWEKDCLFEFTGPLDLNREYALFGGFFGLANYGSVSEKCNLDPDRDGDGAIDGDDGNPLNDPDELTVPFRYDIPTLQLEHEQQRIWETRTSMQREIQDPRAFQQYNHLMFGECVGRAFLRYFGDDDEDLPISCSELAECNEALGDPFRNTHTALSLGSRLELQVTWEDILDANERDPEDIVCEDEELGEIMISEVQPPFPDNPCEPGSPGCPYKLSRDYYMPQFFVEVGGVKKPKTAETANDAYGSIPRSLVWEPISTEAETPHESGHYVNYEDKSSQRTNSGRTAIRLASKSNADLGDVMTNRFVSYIDAVDETYDYNSESTIWDAGGDVKSLCTISSVNDLLIIPDLATETTTLVSNEFVGDETDHKEDETAASSTYGTNWGMARDEAMSNDYFWRDVLDTLQRYSSGGGVQLDLMTAWAIVRNIASRGAGNVYKSFAERIDNWAQVGYPSYMNTEYCIAEDTFEAAFPAYGTGGYPGGHACYPWIDVPSGENCDAWPGPPGEWPPTPEVSALGYNAGSWPGIEGELRTCRALNCEIRTKTRTCDEEICRWVWNSRAGVFVWVCSGCGDNNGDGNVDSNIDDSTRGCNDGELRACLVEQRDNWDEQPPDPPPLDPPDYDDENSSIRACDLEKAGPMQEPGDIWKDHSARIVQQPFFGQSQENVDTVSLTANYTALSLTSKVEERRESHKVSFVDYASTNDISGGGPAQAIDPDRLRHRNTAGTNSQGFGTGAAVDLLKTISHPERFGSLVEPLPDWIPNCNFYDPNSWCYAIQPPGPIDLDSLDGGACNPNTTRGACPLNGYVPAIAERILGAAGANSGVDGAVLLAAIYGEGGWIGPGARLDWIDANVRAWSEPWYARIPGCNDMVPTAQGPFGMITRWFEGAVANGGYHPSRVSPTNGQVIVSKCNFIDAAYAAAQMLGGIGCNGFSAADVRQRLAVYRGGSQANPADVPQFLVDTAMNCR